MYERPPVCTDPSRTSIRFGRERRRGLRAAGLSSWSCCRASRRPFHHHCPSVLCIASCLQWLHSPALVARYAQLHHKPQSRKHERCRLRRNFAHWTHSAVVLSHWCSLYLVQPCVHSSSHAIRCMSSRSTRRIAVRVYCALLWVSSFACFSYLNVVWCSTMYPYNGDGRSSSASRHVICMPSLSRVSVHPLVRAASGGRGGLRTGASPIGMLAPR